MIFQDLSEQKIEDILNSKETSDMLDDWPIERAKFLSVVTTLTSHGGSTIKSDAQCKYSMDYLPIYQSEQTSIQKLNQTINVETLRPISRSHFQALCIECHGDSAKGRLNFHLNDAALFKEYLRKYYEKVATEIERNKMPQRNAALQPSEQLRKDLVDWLRSQKFLESN